MPFKSALFQKITMLGRLVITLLFAICIIPRVDWHSLHQSLRQSRPGLLVIAIAVIGVAITLAGIRWSKLLAHQDIHLTGLAALRLTLTGLFFELFFLGSVGGDTAKFIGTLRHAPDRKIRLGLTLVQDRLIGLGTLLLVLCGFIAWHRPELWANQFTRPIAMGVLIAGLLVVVTGAFLCLLAAADIRCIRENSGRIWDLTRKLLRQSVPGKVLLPVLALSVAIHLLAIMAGWLAAHALGLPLSFSQAGLVLGLTSLALSLPITFAGLGVRDGMLLWLLPVFGYKATGTAAGLSGCLLGISLLWSLVGGVVFFWTTRRGQTP